MLLLLGKIVKQKEHLIPGGIAEISVTFKDFKDAEMVVTITFLFNSPICFIQNMVGLWEMMIQYHKLN